jgi:membrane protease YdiL (CAAX protease family)
METVRRTQNADPAERNYLDLSLHPAVSVLACLPLFAAYEAGLFLLGSGERNAAEWALFRVFSLAGPAGTLALRLLLCLSAVLSLVAVLKERIPCSRVCAFLALEGTAYGVLLGPASLWLSHPLAASHHPSSLAADLVASVGAGLYEELVFRLCLLSVLALVLARAADSLALPRMLGHAVAVVLSALAFALFHHIGPGAEPLTAGRFLYRSAAGVLLGGLFVVRGFGVAVYCHAAYDVFYFLSEG